MTTNHLSAVYYVCLPPLDNYMRRACDRAHTATLILPKKERRQSNERARESACDQNKRRFIKLSKVIKMTQNVALGRQFRVDLYNPNFWNRATMHRIGQWFHLKLSHLLVVRPFIRLPIFKKKCAWVVRRHFSRSFFLSSKCGIITIKVDVCNQINTKEEISNVMLTAITKLITPRESAIGYALYRTIVHNRLGFVC